MLDLKDARHLAERAGLGPEWDRVTRFRGKDRMKAVDGILAGETPVILPPPRFTPFAQEAPRRRNLVRSGRRKEAIAAFRRERKALQEWAVLQLLHNPAPLQERMVWFWHNHFTTSILKVRFGQLMLEHDRIIRQHAMGRFSDMLPAVSLSGAMLIYLDGRRNRKEHPNENFARELLELFTLGVGHYTERDIREGARALTGWVLNPRTGRVEFRRRRHDDGIKEFLGRKGRFGAMDIFRIILAQPRTAEFICEKLWREFVSLDAPPPETIREWAATFRNSGYDIKAVLRAILTSDAFWSQKVRGALVKSPIDLVIGTLRTFELEDDGPSPGQIVHRLKAMGQDLYQPPDVKGWRGGKEWLDDVRLLRRQAFLRRLLRGQAGTRRPAMRQGGAMGKNMGMMMAMRIPELPPAELEDWLLAMPPVKPARAKNPRRRLRQLLLDPVYQVK